MLIRTSTIADPGSRSGPGQFRLSDGLHVRHMQVLKAGHHVLIETGRNNNCIMALPCEAHTVQSQSDYGAQCT